ncbi:MAG: class I SAM-dependent methyltransferase, partial [Candidatus Omnitrophica bacterium]|nr:class I SAM-dependent methyltransferase [Candidatus Omnitrophota bacterium]
ELRGCSSTMNNLIYGDMYNQDPYVRKRFAECCRLLEPFIKKGIKILDIGCYTADILNVIKEQVDYLGIDSDKEALKIAKMRGAKILEIDFEKQGIPLDQKFDIVIATEILEHLKDPQELLNQIKLLLKDDAVVLVSLPNECTLYHRIKVVFGQGIDGTGFAPHYHLHFPTMRQNHQFISKNFRIIKVQYWAHADVGGLAGKLFKMIPQTFWSALADFSPSLFARGAIYLCRKI